MYDIIILGAGIAGLTCALYANRAGGKVLVIEKEIYGGQIINTPGIENYPGCPNVSGYDLMQTVYKQSVTDFQTEMVYSTVTGVSLDGKVKEVTTKKGTYRAKAVVIATGAKHRKLDCPGEERLTGHGVSYCATCDGAFFRNKDVAVVGGGNTAVQDAAYLAKLCRTVYLIHRRDKFRAAPVEVKRALSLSNVNPVYDSIAETINGEKSVEGITVKSVKTGNRSELEVSGIFIAVGAAPENELFRGILDIDEQGYILAGEDCKTSLPGVFAAGDTRSKEVRQLVTAAADGAVSAEMAMSL